MSISYFCHRTRYFQNASLCTALANHKCIIKMRHLSRPIQNRKWWFRKPCITEIIAGTKGQLNSEWIYEVIVSPKMPTKNFPDFCPSKQTRIVDFFGDFLVSVGSFLVMIFVCLIGQKSGKFLVGISGETMTSYIHSEFSWPLGLGC